MPLLKKNNFYNMAKIQFWRGTQAQYDVLEGRNGNTLYFITDAAGKIYLDGKVVAANDLGNITSAVDVEKQAREAADAQIRTDFAAADTALQGNIDTVTNKIGIISDATVAAAISRLDEKDVELNSKIDGLTLSGGGMVYTGVLRADYEAKLAGYLTENKLNKGATFTIDFVGDLYGHAVEIGDMAIFTSATPDTAGDINGDSFVIVQANLSAAVQSSVADLSANTLVLGNGGKNVKVSTITEAALSSAIDKANDAVLKTGDQTMAGKLTAAGFVGNVTGDVSGSAGKLKTAQNISISGGVTSDVVSFDGTAAVALNVTAVDASKLTGVFAEGMKADTTSFGVVKLASALVNNSDDAATSGVVKAAIDGVNTELGQVKTTANANKTAIGDDSDIAAADGSLYARIKALREASNTHASKISTLEGNVAAAQNAITDNASAIGLVSDRVDATEAQLTWIVVSTPSK